MMDAGSIAGLLRRRQRDGCAKNIPAPSSPPSQTDIGHSRAASLRFVMAGLGPAIHVCSCERVEGVDHRDEPGDDDRE
jgi:hypothetical protein